MPDVDLSELLATPSYRPSGKCSLALVPLTLVTLALAVAMAYILYLSEGDYYYPVLTPGIVAIPVFIAAWLTLSFGRCRNVRVAVVVSVLATLVYYLGYWKLSYYLNVTRHGQQAIHQVELNSGSRGLWGYFLFRLKVSHPQEFLAPTAGTAAPTAHGDKLLNAIAFGAELAILAYIALLIGLANSRRVFYEHLGRWAESYGFQLQPGDTQSVLQIVQSQMWSDLVKLRHVETDFTARVKVAALLFTIELLADVPEEPIYITLRANRLGADGRKVVQAFGGQGDFFFRQIPLSVESSRRFRHYFAKDLEAAFLIPRTRDD